MIGVKYFKNEYEINKFLSTLKDDQIIDVKFASTTQEQDSYDGKYVQRYVDYLLVYKTNTQESHS